MIYELFNCMKNFIKKQNIGYVCKLTFMLKKTKHTKRDMRIKEFWKKGKFYIVYVIWPSSEQYLQGYNHRNIEQGFSNI